VPPGWLTTFFGYQSGPDAFAQVTPATPLPVQAICTGASSAVASVTPTVGGGAYSAGDAVGGKQTLTGVAGSAGGTVAIESVVVTDVSNQKAPFTILFFDADPSAATITNNAAFAFSTDAAKLVGKVNVAASDYETVDSKAVAVVKSIALMLKANGTADLYAAVVTTGTPTYAGAGDLTFKYGFLL
jgi:hypothetical protein